MSNLTIEQYLIPGRPQQPVEKHEGKYIIIIHNTATPEADAPAETAYFHREWANRQSFVHAFVDWNGKAHEHATVGEVVWGAGYVNKYSWLQVEQCISNDNAKNVKSAEYVAEYVARKIKESGLKYEDFKIISHADASVSFGGTDHMDTIVGPTWTEFLAKVQGYLGETAKAQPVAQEEPATSGKFRCSTRIKARSGQPSRKAKHIYTFNPGDTIKINRVLIADGYIWIEQSRNSGDNWYIPITEIESLNQVIWGKIEN